jgi:hypothetical protein
LGNGGVTDRLNAKLPTDQPDIILLVLVQAQPDKVCGAPCPAGQGFSPVPAHDILALPGGAKFAAPPNESPASAITWTTASLEARKNSWAHNPFARKAFVARPATFPLTPHLTVFTDSVTRRATPADVLDTLDELAKKCLPPLSVWGRQISNPVVRLALHSRWERRLSSLVGSTGLVERVCGDGQART